MIYQFMKNIQKKYCMNNQRQLQIKFNRIKKDNVKKLICEVEVEQKLKKVSPNRISKARSPIGRPIQLVENKNEAAVQFQCLQQNIATLMHNFTQMVALHVTQNVKQQLKGKKQRKQKREKATDNIRGQKTHKRNKSQKSSKLSSQRPDTPSFEEKHQEKVQPKSVIPIDEQLDESRQIDSTVFQRPHQAQQQQQQQRNKSQLSEDLDYEEDLLVAKKDALPENQSKLTDEQYPDDFIDESNNTFKQQQSFFFKPKQQQQQPKKQSQMQYDFEDIEVSDDLDDLLM